MKEVLLIKRNTKMLQLGSCSTKQDNPMTPVNVTDVLSVIKELIPEAYLLTH